MSDFETAADPRTSADELRRIAAQSPELGAIVAQNPSCYPELLDWPATTGTPGFTEDASHTGGLATS